MAATSTGRHENYPSIQGKVISILNITAGVTCFICNIINIILGDTYTYPGVGIWGGILMVTAGAIGLAAAKKKKKRVIIAFIIISTLASLAAIGAIVSAGLGMGHRDYVGWTSHHPFTYLRNCVLGTCHRNGYPIIPCVYTRDAPCETRVAMNSLMLIAAVVQIVATLWAFAIALFCHRRERTSGKEAVNHVCHFNPAYNGEPYQIAGVLIATPNISMDNIEYPVSGQGLILPFRVGTPVLPPSYNEATRTPQPDASHA